MFLEVSQTSQENTCARVSFLIKLQASGLAQMLFCEFCEISKTTFLQNTSGRLFLCNKKRFRQQWMFGIILRDFRAKMEKLARNGSKQKKCQIFLISLFSKFVNMDWFQELGAFQRRIQNPVKHQICSVLWKLLTATNF